MRYLTRRQDETTERLNDKRRPVSATLRLCARILRAHFTWLLDIPCWRLYFFNTSIVPLTVFNSALPLFTVTVPKPVSVLR